MRPVFDVHDEEISPAVYCLLFSYYRECLDGGNDMVHEIDVESIALLPERHNADAVRAEFNELMENPGGACYGHPRQLASLRRRRKRPSLEDAVAEFLALMAKNGVDGSGTVLIKIWW